MGTLANSEDPDKMQHYATALFAMIKSTFREKNTLILEIIIKSVTPIYTMDHPDIIVCSFMKKSIDLEWVYPFFRPPDKSAFLKIIFFISHPKHILWVLKRTVSMRRFF